MNRNRKKESNFYPFFDNNNSISNMENSAIFMMNSNFLIDKNRDFYDLDCELRETFCDSSEEKEEINEINGLISILNGSESLNKNSSDSDEILEILNRSKLASPKLTGENDYNKRTKVSLKGKILSDNKINNIFSCNTRNIPPRVSNPLFKNN